MEANVVRRRPFGSNPLVGERGTDTHRRVLAAALQVFDETAFAEASVEQIAERAGCSRPAFYQYFSSKEDVFWALAAELGARMVDLARQLGPIGPDAEGIEQLTDWVDAFMDLHEEWAPVFAAFPSASRGQRQRVASSAPISDETGRALLKAFGIRRSRANERVVTNLVAVLLRCSFYAEAAPKGMSREPLVVGTARFIDRVLAGPIDGVNLRRDRPARRRRVEIIAPLELEPHAPLRARGERTRRALLDAGGVVLPERGYHDARVDDLVEAAGVSHGTFYRYFDSKDDFFRVLAAEASARMVEQVDRLQLDAPPDELRDWLRGWFDAYESDGGIISTWQDMRTSPELAAFSMQVAAAVFTRLERLLDRRDFGQPQVSATLLLALIERAPYHVSTLGFGTRDEVIESTVTIIRRGFLGLEE